MKLDIKAFSLASGLLFSLLSLLCAIFVWLAPQTTLKFFSNWFHGVDLTQIFKPTFTFGEFLVGLLSVFVVAYVGGAILAWLYNVLEKKFSRV